jgi:hypothetical protein
MSTTPMSRFSSLPILLAIMALACMAWAASAVAQGVPQAGHTAGSRLPWPSTGGGQPDFEFERAEVYAEATKQAQTQGTEAPVPPKLEDLLEDFTLDPLGLLASQMVSTTQVSSSIVSETTVLPLSDPTFANLPGIQESDTNLTEFTATLQRTAQQFVANWQPRLADYSLDHLLRSIQLQAVVTSPQTYAVINNQQYQVGDSFVVPFTLAVPDIELLAALEATMPAADSLPAETYAKYVQVYEGTVAQLAQQKSTNASAFVHTQQIPVTILDIQNRKVMVNLNGTRQELSFDQTY